MRSSRHRCILISALLLVLIVVCTIGGVSAAWVYNTNGATPSNEAIPVGLFLWQEIPTGEEGVIIEQTGTAIETSLNNPNSDLNASISSKQDWGLSSISSVDNIHGGNLRTELGLDQTTNFLVQFPDANTRVLYTTTVRIGGTSSWGAVNYLIPRGEWIYPVYKTVATKNASGVWEQGKTMRGYAKSDEYVTFFSAAPFFDPASWTRGKIGTSISNAIYAYAGQRVKVNLDQTTDKIYYKLVLAKANTRIKVTIASPQTATVTVLDSSGAMAKGVKNNGSGAIKFSNPNANMTYYLEVTGGTDIVFDIM